MAERLYGLFKPVTINGKRRYQRVGTDSYRRPVAVQRWQDRLIYEGLTLRPLPTKAPQGASHTDLGQCKPCFEHLHTQCARGDCHCACRVHNG